MAHFKLALNGEEKMFEATRQGSQIRIADESGATVLHLLSESGEVMILEAERPDGSRRRLRLAGHRDGDKRQLWLNGRLLTYQRVRERGSGTAAGSGSLAATIPAVVAEILVGEGDSVQEGDKLILLESMKMVIPIQAPYDGTVTAVNCQTGESVQAGVPLMEIEPVE